MHKVQRRIIPQGSIIRSFTLSWIFTIKLPYIFICVGRGRWPTRYSVSLIELCESYRYQKKKKKKKSKLVDRVILYIYIYTHMLGHVRWPTRYRYPVSLIEVRENCRNQKIKMKYLRWTELPYIYILVGGRLVIPWAWSRCLKFAVNKKENWKWIELSYIYMLGHGRWPTRYPVNLIEVRESCRYQENKNEVAR